MQSIKLVLYRRIRVHTIIKEKYSNCLSTLHEPYMKCSKTCVSITTKKLDQFSLPHYFIKLPFSTVSESEPVDCGTFEKVCEETLDSLSEYFDELIETATYLKSADISYSSGVLTVAFGDPYGTYVINRQSPNKQIWLSSPTSGPKRYDFVLSGQYWVYKHDGQSLHELLQNEISKIMKEKVDFSKCSYSNIVKT